MSAAALGHAFAGQRVGHPVARTSPAAPWPGEGLRLAGSVGMLLLRNCSLPGGMYNWLVVISPCLGKCSFTTHFLNSSANPNRA